MEEDDGGPDPAERVGEYEGALYKGYMLKDAVSAKGNSQSRYFVVTPACLLYYESARDSVFKPKGAWCLDDCRSGGLLKRAGLGVRQAVLLRGRRELVLTAESREELSRCNKAITSATSMSAARIAELEAQCTRLRGENQALVVALELERTALRDEREARVRERRATFSGARGCGASFSRLSTEHPPSADSADSADSTSAGVDGVGAASTTDREERAARESEALHRLTMYRQQIDELQHPSSPGGAGVPLAVVAATAPPVPPVDDALSSSAATPSPELHDQLALLRAQLHSEVEARQEADLLRDAALQAQIELQDMKEDLALRVRLLEGRAAHAADRASRMREEARDKAVAAPEATATGDDESSSEAPAAGGEGADTALHSSGRSTFTDASASDDYELAVAEAVRAADEAEVAKRELRRATAIGSTLTEELSATAAALRRLGVRLRGVDAPEARLLYAAMLASRAKLTHVVDFEEWHIEGNLGDGDGVLEPAPAGTIRAAGSVSAFL